MHDSTLVWPPIEKARFPTVSASVLMCIIFFLQGEEDGAAIDVNFSGNPAIDKIMLRYIPSYYQPMSLKLGDLNGETKVSGSLLRP